MPKPICVKCRVEYRPEKNDVRLEEMASFGGYKLWCADLLKCPKCGHEIITGYGREPYAEHFQPDYSDLIENAKRYGFYRCYEYREGLETDPSASREVRNLVLHGGQSV